MKRIFLFLCATMLTAQAWAQHFDFSAVSSSGQTLYYKKTSAREVSVVYPNLSGSNFYSGYTKPSGDLVIPQTVTKNSVEYSVTSIGTDAFYGCSGLTSVTIDNSVTSIGQNAFKGCSNLQYNKYHNAVYLGNKKNPYLYLIKANSYDITECEIHRNCRIITDFAFEACRDLTKVTIPESVTCIGMCAFEGCSGLTTVTIPNSVTSIGGSAFYGCNSLTSVTIPNSVTSIGWQAFYECSGLTTVTIGNSVTSIDDEAFLCCSSLTSVTIPNSVTSIGNYAFSGCSGLTTVTIGNSVTSIGDLAFGNCDNLASVTIGNSVENFGMAVFYKCGKLREINIDSDNANLTYERGMLFNKDKTTIVQFITGTIIDSRDVELQIGIPNSVINIGKGAFAYCERLFSVTIPNSVTNIGDLAFYHCPNLMHGYPNNSSGSYREWFIIPNSVTSIGELAFGYCERLRKITIPNSIISIGQGAFDNRATLFCECEKSQKPEKWLNFNSYNVVWDCKILNVTHDDEYGYVQADGFEVEPEVGSLWYLNGATATLTARPNDDCHFVKWSDGSTENPHQFSVTESKTYTATFEAHTEAYKFENITPATCTTSGSKDSVVYCSVCNEELYREQLVIPAKKHNYGEPIYTWSDDKATCTATKVCTNDNNHVVTETVNSTSEITLVATCEAVGTRTFTAELMGEGFATQQTTEEIPALGHNYGTPTYVWAEDGSTCTATAICQRDESHVATENATITSAVTTAATCEGDGTTTYTATFENELFSTQTKAVVDIPATGHSYSNIVTAPTCTAVGFTTHTCSVCEYTYNSDTVAANGHTVVVDAAVPATTTSVGKTEGSHCSVCNTVLVAQEDIPMLANNGGDNQGGNNGNENNGGGSNNQGENENQGGENNQQEGNENQGNNGGNPATAVADAAASSLNIYAHHNIIVVENATDEICVYDAMGQLICRDAINRVRAENRTEIRIATPGLYIVKVGGTAKRVMVN